MNQKYLKPLIIFGGGLLLFLLMKPKTVGQDTSKKTQSFDDSHSDLDVVDKKKNAEIVMKAFISAMENGESQQRLDELNKECLKDFGMECRISQSGKAIVFDKNGKKVLSS